MALQAKTEEQRQHIESLLVDDKSLGISEIGIKIDDVITFDEMAAIVDYLRTSAPKMELFEDCWKAYNRKGSKKKSLDYWKKLTDDEKDSVLPHIKAYAQSRELQYQKDFERYLRDKIFKTIVFNNNKVVYDPTKKEKGMKQSEVYMPTCDGALNWNDYYSCFMYTGYWDGKHMADGYDDDNRPNGATITLNNGRGTITWNSDTKTWDKV